MQNVKDISFDVKQEIPKKFLPDVRIKKIVHYDDSFESYLEERSAENLDVSCLTDIGMEKKVTDYKAPMDKVSDNVASSQVSAHCGNDQETNNSNETQSADEVNLRNEFKDKRLTIHNCYLMIVKTVLIL